MNYYIGYRKSDGLVVYYSDGENVLNDKFDQKLVDVPEEDKKKIDDGYKTFFRDGVLEFEETEELKAKKAKEVQENIRKMLKDKGEKLTQKEMVGVLKSLIG